MQSFGRKGRLEDARMLTGRGRYVSDWQLPGQAHGCFVRSDRAHAEILGIETDQALKMPGVLAVLTGEDVKAAGLNGLPAAAPMKGRGGADQLPTYRPALAQKRVRYVGDPVALVVAETAAQAQDAAPEVVANGGGVHGATWRPAQRAEVSSVVSSEAVSTVDFSFAGARPANETRAVSSPAASGT
jgi:carbon-monoxide dehydrogenase large subunit